jgi:hypothetical protein
VRETVKLTAEPVAEARDLILKSIDDPAIAVFHVEKHKAGNRDDRKAWLSS